jgi:hypothetical protein
MRPSAFPGAAFPLPPLPRHFDPTPHRRVGARAGIRTLTRFRERHFKLSRNPGRLCMLADGAKWRRRAANFGRWTALDVGVAHSLYIGDRPPLNLPQSETEGRAPEARKASVVSVVAGARRSTRLRAKDD